MTDKEIVKALECCISSFSCDECPYHNVISCSIERDVLDLINRQQAEIAEYQKHIDNDIIYVKRVKSEAIKEFAERLKEKAYTNNYCQEVVLVDVIDTVEKEMTEGNC